MKKVREEGRDEKSVEVVIEMLRAGEPIEKISRYTRLSKEQIEQIARSLS